MRKKTEKRLFNFAKQKKKLKVKGYISFWGVNVSGWGGGNKGGG